jgi:hypothetical protein
MNNQLTSLLVNKQVPEFIREEYPLFITFLEAYYEFLENKQGTQLNDLTTKAKELRDISNVDESIDDFEQQFLNSYAQFLPKDTDVDKSFLIKNVLPLYLSKGSENSFKLLFRLLFSEELEVKYPKNNILRASDGKWEIENLVKVSDDVYVTATGNGTKKEFYIFKDTNLSDITVYVNGTIQTTGYYIRKESSKLLFTTAPANGAAIRVLYSLTDKAKFRNRKIVGVTSGASALVEKTSTNIVNNKTVTELYISPKTLIGIFSIGERITTNIIAPDDSLINVELTSVSSLARVNVINGGASYNVGDPAIVNSASATKEASATVSKVFKGTITKVTIADGGAGFNVASRIAAVGYANTELDFAISNVLATGANTANVFTIFSNIISDVDPANTILTALDWHFPGNVATTGNTYLATPIAHAMSNVSYTGIGEIRTIAITTANAIVATTPTLNAEPAITVIPAQTANTTGTTTVKIDTFGSLGKLVIINPGVNYAVGDELIFDNKPMSFGIGAAAEVVSIGAGGTINKVAFVPSKITGTVNVTSVSNVMVHGIGTSFTSELIVGDKIMIGGETKRVTVIASDTSLNVNSTFTEIKTSKPIRLWGKDLLGGQGYTNDKLPTITISSTLGTDSNVVVTTIMGDGENLIATGEKKPGEIEEIIVTDPGEGFASIPTIKLSDYGDGTATANATLTPTYETLDGRWATSDSILSSQDRRLQGRDYYINYSYLLSSTTEFAKYKKIFKELLHPAGFKMYGEIQHQDILDFTATTTESLIKPYNIRTLSGTVNIANASIYVTGTNTKFNVANTNGVITIGAYIAVNNEIRVVSNIISNTNLAVTSAFTITANNEALVVMNTVYDAVATEVLEEVIAENELIITVES